MERIDELLEELVDRTPIAEGNEDLYDNFMSIIKHWCTCPPKLRSLEEMCENCRAEHDSLASSIEEVA